MGGAVAVGRLGGVTVRVHRSVLVIAVLLAWSLATQVLPTSYPEAPAAWAAASVAAAVFLLGLLAHELTHAVIAHRNGVRVQDVTPWLFGGVARLPGVALSPGAELRIAGSGPLFSLLIGPVQTGGRTLVFDRGRPVGIVTRLDVTRVIERPAFRRTRDRDTVARIGRAGSAPATSLMLSSGGVS